MQFSHWIKALVGSSRPILLLEWVLVCMAAWVGQANPASIKVGLTLSFLAVVLRILSFRWVQTISSNSPHERIGGIYDHLRYPFASSFILILLSAALYTRNLIFMLIVLIVITTVILHLRRRASETQSSQANTHLVPLFVPSFMPCRKTKGLKLSKFQMGQTLSKGYWDSTFALLALFAYGWFGKSKPFFREYDSWFLFLITILLAFRSIYIYRSEVRSLLYAKRLFEKS